MYYLIFTHRKRGLLLRRAFLLVLAHGITAGGCETIDKEYSEIYDLSRTNNEAIVNGTIVTDDIYDGVVALRMKSNICTGTLIDPNVVLTAGHCVHYMDFNIVDEPETITIYGGPHMSQKLSTAVEVVPHVTWKGQIKKNAADLAIILLGAPITDTHKYCVQSKDDPAVGTTGVIVGYGRENKEGRSGTQRVGKTTILSKKDDDALLELGNPTGTCLGDSGGPFFTVDKKGQHALTGVTSFGSGSCSPDGGGFNVNVVKYRKWIARTVENHTRRTLADCEDLALGDNEIQAYPQKTDEDTAPERSQLDLEAKSQDSVGTSTCNPDEEECQSDNAKEYWGAEETIEDWEAVDEEDITCSFAAPRISSPGLLTLFIKFLF